MANDDRLHSKTWGRELWFANNSKYCGKIITIMQDQISSGGAYHYHPKKDETFFVLEGNLLLDYVIDDDFYRITLKPNQSFRVPPGMKHRFSTLSEQCKFVEVSTTHEESDSIRQVFRNGKWEKVEKKSLTGGSSCVMA